MRQGREGELPKLYLSLIGVPRKPLTTYKLRYLKQANMKEHATVVTTVLIYVVSSSTMQKETKHMEIPQLLF